MSGGNETCVFCGEKEDIEYAFGGGRFLDYVRTIYGNAFICNYCLSGFVQFIADRDPSQFQKLLQDYKERIK